MFPRQCCAYTVGDVLWWLKELGVDGDAICIPALCTEIVDLRKSFNYRANLRRIWSLKKEVITACVAQEVPAFWVGGPPNNVRRFKGSMLQLLMDRILADVNAHGIQTFIEINKEFKMRKRMK
jgi:hypothetical protein